MIKERKKSSLGKLITLVIILLIPGLLHLYLRQTGENTYRALPFLGKNGTKEITTIRPFQLLNENSEYISFPERNSITVVNFMHSNCDSFGNLMSSAMEKVATKFGKHPLINLYSISLDSNDTPEVMKEYSKRYNSSLTNWQFLSGPSVETSRVATEEFLLDGYQDILGNNKVIHSPFFVLLDSKQQIRGYYEFYTKDEVDRLIGEMILLVTEETRNMNDI